MLIMMMVMMMMITNGNKAFIFASKLPLLLTKIFLTV